MGEAQYDFLDWQIIDEVEKWLSAYLPFLLTFVFISVDPFALFLSYWL